MLEFALILLYGLSFFVSPLLFFSAIRPSHATAARWLRLSGGILLAGACIYVFATCPEATTAGYCGLSVLILTSAVLGFTLAGAPRGD